MAQTTDMAAEKARKQKIILIVAAVMLAGLAAFQLPKILGGSSSTPAAAPTEEGVVDPATGVAGDLTGTTGATGGTGAAVVVGKPAGFVAGVPLPSTSRAKVSTSQLASFTLFESKDPFVQQVSEETASSSPSEEQGAPAANGGQSADQGGGKPGVEPTPADPGALPGVAPSGGDTGGSAAPGTGSPDAGAGGAPVAPSEPYAYATMMVNGNPEQLELKKTFPGDEDVFVLVAAKKNAVQIGVAGGSFQGGKPVTVKLGKKLTLVNTATGERWVLKLLYTGSQPEVLETFSTGSDQAAAVAVAPAQ